MPIARTKVSLMIKFFKKVFSWTETAVPVHVSRVIEKPVPADTMTNKVLLGMYMDQTEDVDRWVEEKANSWFGSSGKDQLPAKEKMSDSQIKAVSQNNMP